MTTRIVRKHFQPELFRKQDWKNVLKDHHPLVDPFIRGNQFFYSYGGDYFNMNLARAAMELVLEYEEDVVEIKIPTARVRVVRVRAFLESNGKLRFWTTDWQVTQPMLEVAPYFHSWVGINYEVHVNAIEKYANVK